MRIRGWKVYEETEIEVTEVSLDFWITQKGERGEIIGAQKD